jgi:HK97 family phage prohead protease
MSMYSYKSLEMQFKDINAGAREVVFKFAAYGNVDSYGDISTKGMFSRSINNNFKRIKHLLDHDSTKALGVPLEIWDDNDGAYMKSKVGTHTLGNDFLEMAMSGIITEASYGYEVVREEKSDAGNVLKEAKLWEASNLQAWGANELTNLVSVTKRMEELERFCKNAKASDDTIEKLLIEIKQLQTKIAQLVTTDSSTEVDTLSVEMEQKVATENEALARIKLLELKLN